MSSIETRVKQVMGRVFGINPGQISDDASPDSIKEWNSLRYMSLVIALEEEFNIRFNDLQVIEMMNYALILLTVKEALNPT